MATWQKENDTDKAIKVILFIISPFIAFLYSLRTIKTKSSYTVFFLFCVFFGLSFSVSLGKSEENRADGASYREKFELYKYVSDSEFYKRFNEYLSFEEGAKDYYFDTVAFYVSRVTDNYHYANVHMITAIVLILLSFLVVQTFDSPYYISIVSLMCQIGKTFALLFAVAKFFQLKVYQLFPVELILKILLPSIIILSIEYYLFVIYFDLKLILALVVSFILYAFLFLLYTIWIKIDYLSIFKPLIKKINN